MPLKRPYKKPVLERMKMSEINKELLLQEKEVAGWERLQRETGHVMDPVEKKNFKNTLENLKSGLGRLKNIKSEADKITETPLSKYKKNLSQELLKIAKQFRGTGANGIRRAQLGYLTREEKKLLGGLDRMLDFRSQARNDFQFKKIAESTARMEDYVKYLNRVIEKYKGKL
ncbi:MAG: hypothetical protein HYW05_01475 [Candidatus Diapherotrites archaeon]|nr:hypothetical protein [Candidatus Diapherotrites archaeon]